MTNSHKENLDDILKYTNRAMDTLTTQNTVMKEVESAVSLLACIQYRTQIMLNQLTNEIIQPKHPTLEINVRERRSGKTTTAIELLNEDSDAILLVANKFMINFLHGNYNVDKKVFTYQDFLNGNLKGIKFSKVIIDEGLSNNLEAMARLYYELGRQHIETIVYGTL